MDKDEYVELWKFFRDKSISVKGAMFNTISWILSIAVAILGFIVASVADGQPKNPDIDLSLLMKTGSVAGMMICAYAFIALEESAKWIRKHLRCAEKCLSKSDRLKDIVGTDHNKDKSVGTVWLLRGLVITIFGVFVVGFGWSCCFSAG
ncbi:MAG: hypothetical protein OEV49_02665 [candidate division Zixibacteria bacterium]|nr:hypothetical protein [candidate division Zixibacteria bacterium]MDH4033859.1 hypothetical protein [candidate division Zixibacteria bacterium]